MKLLDLLRAPWAIEPSKLREIQEIYATHLRGEKIDIAAVEARLGRPLSNDQQQYTVQGSGVAVLPIQGVIAPKANLFTRVSGGASADMLRLQLESAMADGRVRSIILAIDSPGGSVLGGPELAEAIRKASAEKPIVTLSDGQLASMACWIGAAANAVYITGPTVIVGSLGTVITHDFTPRRDASAGGQTTEIVAGRYKRIASDVAPLKPDGQAYLQEQADYVYGVMLEGVRDYRGIDSTDTVHERMADGRVFIGQQAIDAGLADGFMSLDDLVDQLSADPRAFAQRRKAQPKAIAAVAADVTPTPAAGAAAGTTATPPNLPEDPTMSGTQNQPPLTRASLEAEHPALFAQLRTEFTAAGAAAEIQRAAAVRAQSLPGHEQLIEQLVADGKTTGDQAAAAVLAAERSTREAAARAHAADAPAAVKPGAAPEDKGSKTKAEQADEARAYASEHGIGFVAALKKLGYSS